MCPFYRASWPTNFANLYFKSLEQEKLIHIYQNKSLVFVLRKSTCKIPHLYFFWLFQQRLKYLLSTGHCSRAAVPNLFGTRDHFHGRQFFQGPGVGGWFWDDSSALHLLCTLLLLLLHQLHLRSSGIRSWGLGTPALEVGT